jgi:hypothetical protein
MVEHITSTSNTIRNVNSEDSPTPMWSYKLFTGTSNRMAIRQFRPFHPYGIISCVASLPLTCPHLYNLNYKVNHCFLGGTVVYAFRHSLLFIKSSSSVLNRSPTGRQTCLQGPKPIQPAHPHYEKTYQRGTQNSGWLRIGIACHQSICAYNRTSI